MGNVPPHISWLYDTGEREITACGREIEIWALAPKDDEAVLSAWARHFRQHYISDEELPAMVDGNRPQQRRVSAQQTISRRLQDAGPEHTFG